MALSVQCNLLTVAQLMNTCCNFYQHNLGRQPGNNSNMLLEECCKLSLCHRTPLRPLMSYIWGTNLGACLADEFERWTIQSQGSAATLAILDTWHTWRIVILNDLLFMHNILCAGCGRTEYYGQFTWIRISIDGGFDPADQQEELAEPLTSKADTKGDWAQKTIERASAPDCC